MPAPLFLGIDIGTSAVRAIAIDNKGDVVGSSQGQLAAPRRNGQGVEQDPNDWWQACTETLHALFQRVSPQSIQGVAIDGTSASVLVTDAQGQALGPALMYNDARCLPEAEIIAATAPADSPARGVTSALAKALHLLQRFPRAAHIMHQGDWLTSRFSGRVGHSDENNCLKLGYDSIERQWPTWLRDTGVADHLLPVVHPAGTRIATVTTGIQQTFDLPATTQVVAGTTDGVAAFVATGATETGAAVTSLGSTLVIKILAAKPVNASIYGVYSHRLDRQWLVGGASNTGGAVLERFFSPAAIAAMSGQLDPDQLTGLDYYPLPAPGERFPIHDPGKQPLLEPRPEDDVRFFQGILEGIAQIELSAYQRLAELGAPKPSSIRTVGGGATNRAWTTIRERMLGIPLKAPAHQQAAYGAALLARKGAR